MSRRGWRAAGVLVALALALAALTLTSWPQRSPRSSISPASPTDKAADLGEPSADPADDRAPADLPAAATTSGGEAAQRDGTARPGPELGVGLALREGGLEVGRLWSAVSRRAALVVLWAPDAEPERLRLLAVALRRTRDYHLVALHGARATPGLLAAVAQARDLLPSDPAAVALIAMAAPAQDAVESVAGLAGATALVLVSPRGAVDVEGAAFGWLAGRQALLLVAPNDGAAAPVVAAWSRLPLATRVDAAVAGPDGLSKLGAQGRPWSDLVGWLFAVLPASDG